MKVVHDSYLSKRTPPANITEDDTYIFANEYEKQIHTIRLLTINDCWVLNDTVVAPSKFEFYDTFTHLFNLSWKSKVKRLFLLRKNCAHETTAVWITNEWTKGYFHWITEGLTKLTLLEPNTTNTILLPNEYATISFILPSLNLMGYVPKFYDPNKPLSVDTLYLPSHTGPTGNYNAEVINILRQKILFNFTLTKPNRKIYLSRLKAPRRKISNEKEVTLFLQKQDYEIHFFEDYTFEKQVEIMTETSHLIGLHGAGLTNMLFMQKGGTVLELRNEKDNHNNCYFTLASDLNHSYFYLQNTGDSNHTHDVNITVDLKKLEQVLNQMN